MPTRGGEPGGGSSVFSGCPEHQRLEPMGKQVKVSEQLPFVYHFSSTASTYPETLQQCDVLVPLLQVARKSLEACWMWGSNHSRLDRSTTERLRTRYGTDEEKKYGDSHLIASVQVACV